MDQQFVKLVSNGVISFVPVDAKDAVKRSDKLKKDFGAVADQDEDGNVKLYTVDDVLAAKGKTRARTSNIEKLNELLKK
jgi:hypothetical protein